MEIEGTEPNPMHEDTGGIQYEDVTCGMFGCLRTVVTDSVGRSLRGASGGGGVCRNYDR